MTRRKRILVATGGGDCPGLNAVLRAIVKKATGQHNWEVLGSIDAFNGVLSEPMQLKVLDLAAVSGIHVGPRPNQKVHHFQIIDVGGPVKRSRAVRLGGIDICSLAQERADCCFICSSDRIQ